jgi:putative aminopeptidase FrvX
LFTRAEEVGFVGAIHLAKSKVLPQDLTIISLETSSERGGSVTMGQGVIIRAGDRTSVFDSATTLMLVNHAKAEELPHQRALMQGGTCEATAYALYGYRTGGLCVALGNYHNCGPDDLIGSEYVSLADATGMAQLCVLLGKSTDTQDALLALRERLERDMEQYQRYF